MKFLLTLLFSVLLMAPQLQAATGLSGVIFTNLNKSHFWVDLNAAPTNMVRINLNPTQFNTNTVNNPDGITITNISGIYGGLWTNDNHTWFPVGEEFNLQATNIVAKTTMQVDGGLSTPYDSAVLNVGANCITVGQRTLWRLAGPSTDPADATVSFTTGDQGQWLRVIKFGTDGETFTLTDDALVCDAGGGHLRLRGNWTPTDLGETIDLVSDGNDWFEVSRANPTIPGGDNLWQLDGETLEPVGLNDWPVLVNTRIAVGTNSPAYSEGDVLISYADTTKGNAARRSIDLQLFGAAGANSVGQLSIYPGESSLVLQNNGFGSDVSVTLKAGQSSTEFSSSSLLFSDPAWSFRPFVTPGTAPFKLNAYFPDSPGNILEVSGGGTNQFTISQITDIDAADGTKYFGNDGKFHAASGSGTTINPTDNYLPYRQNSTTFGDSPWNVVTANKLGLATTNAFMFYEWAFGNIGIGEDALKNVDGVNANNNVAFGDQAGKANNAGFDNTYLGNFAGVNNQTGDQNTIVGAGAGASVIDINDTISIGAAASATNSHEIVIGTTSNTKFIVPIASWGSGDGTKVYRNDGTFGSVPAGGGVTGTVINTGTPAVGNVPRYTDTTGTNVSPSTVVIGSNGGVTITNAATTEIGLTINGFSGQTNDLARYNNGGTNVAKVLNLGQHMLPDGTVGIPSIGWLSDNDGTGTGFYRSGTDQIAYAANGVRCGLFLSTGISLNANTQFLMFGNQQSFLSTESSQVFQFGQDGATPSAQTLKAADGSGTDKAGANLTIEGGQSTGTGTSGGIVLRTAKTSVTSGSTANTYDDRARYVAKFVTLTDNTATTLFTVTLPATNSIGMSFTCTVQAGDATDFQSLTTVVTVDAVAKTTTITPVVSPTAAQTALAGSAGTLSVTYTVVDNGSNVLAVKCTADTSLTSTYLRAKIVMTGINIQGAGVVINEI